MLAFIVIFLAMFALVLALITLGLKFVEDLKKKKVTQMLQSAAREQFKVETKVLVEPEQGAGVAILRFLSRFNFARTMEKQIQQAGLTMSLNTLLLLMVALIIPGALIGARFKPLMFTGVSAVVCACVFGLLPYIYVRHTSAKRLAAFEQQFPEALDFLSRAMRAGHAFSMSLEMLSEESPQPLGQEFRKVFNEHNLGLPIETALQNLTDRVPLIDVRFFVSAVLLQRETGGNLSEILLNLAYVIRERFKLKGQVRAASAHGRLTGTILTLMPFALMLGLMAVAPAYLQSMVDDPDGKYIIAIALTLIVIGHFIIRKIIKIKV